MKFLDKKGNTHRSYLGAMASDVIGIIRPNKKKPVTPVNIPMDDNFIDDMHDDDIIDVDCQPADEEEPVYPMDEVFEPGVTPKIPMDKKKHTARIDFENHQIYLEDQDGKVITTTRFDSRLDNCPTKDLFNMIFDEVQSTSHIDPPSNG